MKEARMLNWAFWAALSFSAPAYASSEHSPEHAAAHVPEEHASAAPVAHTAAEEKAPTGKVVAMNATQSRSVRAGELITVGGEPQIFVSRDNFRTELSPRSVAEFDEQGSLRLLRGSALVENKAETAMRTAGARVEFVGRAVVSYDHKEQSSSVFVLEGEARVVNPHRVDSSLRLGRFRGATLVVGGVVPQLIRQLDVGAVQNWLKGYSWPQTRRDALLRGMPGQAIANHESVPQHLEETKIEDYFSSIDTANELQQPDYYERKFDDPDKVVAEQNSVSGTGKTLSPEEAALISLPKTQIDLGFELGPEFLTAAQKKKEVAAVEPRSPRRGLASVAGPKVAKKNAIVAEQGDPEVNLVLSRLRQVRSDKAVTSHESPRGRGPASAAMPVVPDPVYDYSQNF